MKLRFMGCPGVPFGKSTQKMMMQIVAGEVYEVPDTLALFLLNQNAHQWRKVDYKGTSQELPNINIKLVESIIGGKVENLSRFSDKPDPVEAVSDETQGAIDAVKDTIKKGATKNTKKKGGK